MVDSLETRVARLERALDDQQSVNATLLSRAAALVALTYSLLEHVPRRRRQELAESYERYLGATTEQLHAEHQRPEILKEFAEALRRTSC